MRKAVIGIVVAVGVLLGVAAWRTPTAALVSLKLALDRRDLSGVSRTLDYRALTDAALARLVEGRPEEPADIRLVLRGENAWVPAVSSARAYLRIRLERSVERLVEDPEHALDLSWEDLRRALSSLRRSGSVARFRMPGREGEEYVVRMRQSRGRWRIVAVERDGEPVLLAPMPRTETAAAAPAAADDGADDTASDGARGADPVVTEAHIAALVEESRHLTRTTRPPRPRGGKRTPFMYRLEDGSWTVQVASTVDAVEAELEREWFESVGEPAFVREADVRGQTWRRVLIGRYPTRAEAERTIARLADQGIAELAAHP